MGVVHPIEQVFMGRGGGDFVVCGSRCLPPLHDTALSQAVSDASCSGGGLYEAGPQGLVS